MCALGYAVKLWMVNENGEAVFGDGLAELLETIDKYKSLLEASKELGMSYRYALHRLFMRSRKGLGNH